MFLFPVLMLWLLFSKEVAGTSALATVYWGFLFPMLEVCGGRSGVAGVDVHGSHSPADS